MYTVNECCHTCTHTRRLARRRCVATDHCGMSLRAHFRLDINIAEIHGPIDACNPEWLGDDVDNLARPDRPLVLGLYWVDFFGGDGFRALVRIVEKCKGKGVRWARVPSDAVERLLRSTDNNYRLPTAASLVRPCSG